MEKSWFAILRSAAVLLLLSGLCACSGAEDEQGRERQKPQPKPAKTTQVSTAKPVASVPAAQIPPPAESKRLAFEALNRAHLVIEGYYAMFQQWPTSAAELDRPDSLFDTAYLADGVAEGYRLYLALTGDSDYRLWCLPAVGEDAYLLSANKNGVVAVARAEVLQEIKSMYREESRQAALVLLSRI